MSGHKVKEDSAVGLVKWVQGRAKAQTGTPPLDTPTAQGTTTPLPSQQRQPGGTKAQGSHKGYNLGSFL